MRRHFSKALCALLAVVFLLPLIPSPTAAALEPPRITASAAVVMDYDTGALIYAKDPDTLRVPASMTKIMTAYIVYEELDRGTLTMDTPIPISDHVAKISRDKVNYQMCVPLPYNGTVPAGTLLKLMLIYSASASAVALAEYISGSEEKFVERMNETSSRLGLNAHYINTHGHKLNYITARSQAALIRLFIQNYPQVLDITSLNSVTFEGKEYRTTNYLLPGEKYAYEGTDGFKTGNINAAGYCQSVTAVRNGRRLISVVMNSSSGDTRATDNVKLLDYAFDLLADIDLNGSFLDVSGHWAKEAVDTLNSKGVELHAGDILYRPDEDVTRAEFISMLYTALEVTDKLPESVPHPGESSSRPFDDIAGCWARDYIIRAWDRGIADGTGNGRFSPDNYITRQQIMVLLDRVLDLPDENGLNFSDVGSIAFWALEASARVTAAGLLQGTNGRLDPNGHATRAQAAQIVARLMEM